MCYGNSIILAKWVIGFRILHALTITNNIKCLNKEVVSIVIGAIPTKNPNISPLIYFEGFFVFKIIF